MQNILKSRKLLQFGQNHAYRNPLHRKLTAYVNFAELSKIAAMATAISGFNTDRFPPYPISNCYVICPVTSVCWQIVASYFPPFILWRKSLIRLPILNCLSGKLRHLTVLRVSIIEQCPQDLFSLWYCQQQQQVFGSYYLILLRKKFREAF